MMRNAIFLLTVLSLGLVGCANRAPNDGSLASRSAQVGAVELDADSNGGLDIARGGTNATTASGARTNLGVPDTYAEVVGLWTTCTGYLRSDGTCDAPSGAFSWPASDGSYYAARNGAWASLATVFQPLDSDLTTWAGVTSSANGRSLVAATDYSAMRTLLSLAPGVNVQAYDANMIAWPSAISATEVGYLNGLTEALNTTLAAKQPLDTDLTTWAGVTSSANGRSLVSAADYAAMRTLLSLDTGTNVQAYDADLTTYAGITPSVNVQSLLGSSNYAAMRALLDLEVGVDFNPYDVDLASAAGANSAGNSKYWGTDSGGAVGFYDLPSGVPSWLPSTGPTADNQIIQATGVGTSAWTSIVDGLINDAGNSTDDLLSASEINTRIASKEASLGNPSTDGYVLSSTTSGVRSWIAAGGAVDLTAPGPIGSVTPNSGSFTTLVADSFDFAAPAPGETGELGLQEDPTNGNNLVTLKAPVSLASDLVITLPAGVVPSSATSTCTAGQWWYDASYWYVCVAANTWRRAALSTW